MQDQEFVDFYEVLEISPNASRETVERVFRFLAQRCHPDNPDGGDIRRFKLLAQACEVLSGVESRARYDREYQRNRESQQQLVRETGNLEGDSADRHKLLALLYAQRRRDRRKPGLGNTTLETLMGLPTDILEFHIWYFKEKGWVLREESGLLSITAEGVDQIESQIAAQRANGLKRIEHLPVPAKAGAMVELAAAGC